MTDFTTQQKLQAINREIVFRMRVFERRVLAQRMTQRKAEYEIAIMQAIGQDYEHQLARERLL